MTNPNILGLQGRRALVVGGGFGMGRASALLLADAGADVAVADLDRDRATEVASEVRAKGVKSVALSADVTVDAAAKELIGQAAAALGGLDVLINIVGMAAFKSLFDFDEALWDKEFSRNLRQHLFVSRAAARVMADQGTGGRIAMVASVSGIYGAPNHGPYGAAKAGLMALGRTMAQEWGRYGIRVNCVAPDAIATPRVRASYAMQGKDEGTVAKDLRAPLGRLGEPEEIAGPLVFLVSDLSSYVNGQTIIADGGVESNHSSRITDLPPAPARTQAR